MYQITTQVCKEIFPGKGANILRENLVRQLYKYTTLRVIATFWIFCTYTLCQCIVSLGNVDSIPLMEGEGRTLRVLGFNHAQRALFLQTLNRLVTDMPLQRLFGERIPWTYSLCADVYMLFTLCDKTGTQKFLFHVYLLAMGTFFFMEFFFFKKLCWLVLTFLLLVSILFSDLYLCLQIVVPINFKHLNCVENVGYSLAVQTKINLYRILFCGHQFIACDIADSVFRIMTGKSIFLVWKEKVSRKFRGMWNVFSIFCDIKYFEL